MSMKEATLLAFGYFINAFVFSMGATLIVVHSASTWEGWLGIFVALGSLGLLQLTSETRLMLEEPMCPRCLHRFKVTYQLDGEKEY